LLITELPILKKITQKQWEIERAKIIDALIPYDPIKVILFGSFARGDYHAGSDVDLIIIKETDQRFTDRIGTVLEICKSDLAIEPLVYTPAEIERMQYRENDFILTALQEGQIIYEKK
jgi:predicted nucleotidyltransferase